MRAHLAARSQAGANEDTLLLGVAVPTKREVRQQPRSRQRELAARVGAAAAVAAAATVASAGAVGLVVIVVIVTVAAATTVGAAAAAAQP